MISTPFKGLTLLRLRAGGGGVCARTVLLQVKTPLSHTKYKQKTRVHPNNNK